MSASIDYQVRQPLNRLIRKPISLPDLIKTFMAQRKIIVLLSGQIASGKSTVCEGLKKDHGFFIISTRSVLEDLAKERHNETEQKERVPCRYLAGVLMKAQKANGCFSAHSTLSTNMIGSSSIACALNRKSRLFVKHMGSR